MRRFAVLLLFSLALTACASQSANVTPTATPTATATVTLTPTITNTPLPTPTSRPSAMELTRATDPSQQAYVSLVNAVPDLPPVDVYVERLAIAANLGYGRSTQSSGLVAGDYLLRIVPNGDRPEDGPYYYQDTLSVSGGTSSLLLLTGTPDAVSLTVLPISRDSLERGQARVTVVNAASIGTPITVMENGSPLTDPLAYGTASGGIIMPVAETIFAFDNGAGTVATYDIALAERYAYTLILVGSTPDTLNVIQLSERMRGYATMRFINAAPQMASMDIYLDQQPLVSSLDYTRSTDPQGLPARNYTVEVYTAGSDPNQVEALTSQPVNLSEDDSLTLLVVGPPQSLRVVQYHEDSSPTNPLNARIAFVNTLPEVRDARIETQNGILSQAGDIFYGQPPRSVDLLAATYRFTWMKIENNQPTDAVEIALDVQLEPGFSYLYLMTGRMGDVPPVILSDRVGIDESLVSVPIGTTPSPTPEIPTQVRFVNAINGGLPLDVAIDGQLAFTGLAYGDTTALVPISDGDHTIEMRQNGEVLLMGRDMPFNPATNYTVLAYGFGIEPVELMQIDDSQIEAAASAPSLRLINASVYGETHFELAESNAQSGSDDLTLFSESPGGENNRQSLAYGINRIPNTNDILGRAVSDVGLGPIGPHDLYVIDDSLNMVAMIVRGVNLAPGRHYDVIAYQNRDSQLVEGFAVRYPQG